MAMQSIIDWFIKELESSPDIQICVSDGKRQVLRDIVKKAKSKEREMKKNAFDKGAKAMSHITRATINRYGIRVSE